MLANIHRVSWGSIVAGIFTVVAISLLLSTLGTSLGFTILDPYAEHPTQRIGITFLIWSALSLLISLALGGYVAGKLAGITGAIHGFLVWATTLVIVCIVSSMVVMGTAKMAVGTIGAIGSATGAIASGVGSAVTNGTISLTSLFSDLNIDTDIDKTAVEKNVSAILQKTKIATLQPDYLQRQLVKSAGDVKWTLKQIALNPNNVDEAIDELTDKLKTRVDIVTADIDREAVLNAIEQNSDLNRKDAEQVLDNYLVARENIQQSVKQRLTDAQEALKQTKDKYYELTQQAKDATAYAVDEMAKLACWIFVALLIAAFVSMVAGCFGVHCTTRIR